MPTIVPMIILGIGVFLLTCSVAVLGYGIVRYLQHERKELKMVREEI